MGCALAAAVGYVLCAINWNNTVMLMLGLSIAAAGIIASFGIFWVFPVHILSGVAAAGSLALINSIGQIGGIIAPYMVGKVKESPALF